MRIVVTYDVAVTTEGGRRRLNRVAKVCTNYGIRVQNSVFECEVQWDKLLEMKQALIRVIDVDTDSLRIYYLGNNWDGKIEHLGVKQIPDVGRDTLIF